MKFPKVSSKLKILIRSYVPASAAAAILLLVPLLHLHVERPQPGRSAVYELFPFLAVVGELELDERGVDVDDSRDPPLVLVLCANDLPHVHPHHGSLGVLLEVLLDELSAVLVDVLPHFGALVTNNAHVLVLDVGGVSVIKEYLSDPI